MAENTKKRTWLTIVLATVAIVFILAVALGAGVAYFFVSHAQSTPISMEDGQARITAAKARFAGQTAMIVADMNTRAPIVNLPPPDAHGAPITTIRALIYSEREGKLIDAAIPAWVLRMMPNGKVRFLEGLPFDSDRVQITFDDVERHGPGLILDGFDRRGSRVLIWAE
jgi:hypothetical protein